MNTADEQIRSLITDSLTQSSIDARNLAIEVIDGGVIVKGSVPSPEQEHGLRALLAALPQVPTLRYDVAILPTPPSDSANGRGRSPLTGTSAESAHQSRHQLDPD